MSSRLRWPAFLLLIAVAWPLHADWRAVGPFGGPVTTLAVDPFRPETVLAGTPRDGLFRSANRGARWEQVAGIDEHVGPIVLDPGRPGTVYAGLGIYLIKSVDGGRTWAFVSSLPTLHDDGITALAIDSRRRTTLYATLVSSGLFKSTNGGRSWTGVHRGVATQFVTSLAVDPTTSALYSTTVFAGVHRSTDGGLTWRRLGLDKTHLSFIAVAPSDPAVLYAGGTDGLFRSTDRGAHWVAVHGSLPSQAVTAIAIHPRRASTVYASVRAFLVGQRGGLFRTRDGGAHWQELRGGLPGGDALAVALDPTAPSRIYAGLAADGIWTSADGGGTFSPANRGLQTADVLHLAADRERPGTVFGLSEVGLLKTLDAGQSWRIVNPRVFGGWITASVVLDPQSTATVYGSIPGRLERSDDGGRTWRRVEGDLAPHGFTGLVAVDPEASSRIYAATNAGLHRSDDRGETWSAPVDVAPDCELTPYALAVSPAAPSEIYFSGLSGGNCPKPLDGFFKSTDGGATWSQIGDFVRPIVLHPTDPDAVFALDYFSNLIKSIDGGAHFVPARPSLIFFALAIDPAVPGRLYAGDFDQVYVSEDAGESWEPLGSAVGATVLDLAVDPHLPGRLWAATARGVFVLE
jgi:photosystem II stability/assembly factor-like uncharacterized protein